MRLWGVSAAGASIVSVLLLAACGSSNHSAAPSTTTSPPPPPPPAPGKPHLRPKPKPKLVAVIVRDGDTGKPIPNAVVSVRHG